MIALYLTGTVLLALGLYWLGAIHGRDYQTKRFKEFAPHILLADPVLVLLRDGATEVITTTRVEGDKWTATHVPLEGDE